VRDADLPTHAADAAQKVVCLDKLFAEALVRSSVWVCGHKSRKQGATVSAGIEDEPIRGCRRNFHIDRRDSILEPDALLRVTQPFTDDPTRMVATGGTIRAVNGSRVVSGRVVRVEPFGAFVEVEEGLEGLLPVSEMSWQRVQDAGTVVQPGQSVKVVVLKIDAERRKVSLGMKQLMASPWDAAVANYPAGQVVTGRVSRLMDFGAFVELEPGIEGLIHVSEMSWTKRVHHPSEVVKKGDSVDVVILNVDAENKRISLGLKQATEDPWLRIGETYPVGTELKGRVVRLMDKGVVVDIGNDIEGFVPVSQLNFGQPVNSPADIVYETMNLDLRVLEVDPIHRRIVLAVTGIPAEQPPRPETPSKVIPMESDDYNLSDSIPAPPDSFIEEPA